MMVVKLKTNCSRCGHNNHKLVDRIAKTHYDGTVLHVMGGIEEIKEIEEIDEEVSSELSATFNTCYYIELE